MPEPKIEVGLVTDRKIDLLLIGDYNSGKSDRFTGNISIEFVNGRIEIIGKKNRVPFLKHVELVPDDEFANSFIVENFELGKDFHWEQKKRARFRGRIKVIAKENNLILINVIRAEEYLRSVISSEMSARSPIEFLKAHAIISRSWLISQMITPVKDKSLSNIKTENELIKWYDNREHEDFDICADDHCQRYHGIPNASFDRVNRAIEETEGIVLIYGDDICDARYSKCCGGRTEAYEAVWDNNPKKYLKPIFDYKYDPDDFIDDLSDERAAKRWIAANPVSFCNTHDEELLTDILVDFDHATSDFFRWNVRYTQEQLKEIIWVKSGIEFGEIIDLKPLERGSSGRIIRLEITGTERSFIVGKELEIRKWLSKSHLLSSAFIVKKLNVKNKIPQEFELLGAGWGHGVGLCQIGAANMAKQGYYFDEILLHYYTGANLKKIY